MTILLSGDRYPSKNQEGRDGRRYGRKSAAYHEVFDAVKTAAEREIARLGWTTATCECATTIYVIFNRRIRRDSLNIGTAEGNALTAAGAWSDDKLANPATKRLCFDPCGPNRIVVTIVKLHQPWNAVEEMESTAPVTVRAPKAKAVPQPAAAADYRGPTYDNKPITHDRAMEIVRRTLRPRAR